jgi:hypothetical protein
VKPTALKVMRTTNQTPWLAFIPTNIFEAEQALHDFDNASAVGPKLSSTSVELLARLRNLSADAKWEQVYIILQQYPALGNLKTHERYQVCEQRGNVPAHVITKTREDDQPPKQSPVNNKPFRPTLTNYGNTCFFNSILQLIASIPSFVANLLEALLSPNHDSSSYCLAFLKLFIPAIASPSSDPSNVLEIPLVGEGVWHMAKDDWKDFVYRLAVRYDPNYRIQVLSQTLVIYSTTLWLLLQKWNACVKWNLKQSLHTPASASTNTRGRTLCANKESRYPSIVMTPSRSISSSSSAQTVWVTPVATSAKRSQRWTAQQSLNGFFSRSHAFSGLTSPHPLPLNDCQKTLISRGHYGSSNDWTYLSW